MRAFRFSRWCFQVLAVFSFVVVLPAAAMASQQADSASAISFDSLLGGPAIQLSDYQGQVVLVVNTASRCGFTGQYKDLESLYQTYKAQGFAVIGVPSNNFGQQEPGSNEEIAKFCKMNYGVSFPMATKYEVLGENAHPFYQWAKAKLGVQPGWNFHKFLVGPKGHLVRSFDSAVRPKSTVITQAIEQLLSAR